MVGDIDILLVEDNPADVTMVEQVIEERALPGILHVVQTGDEALDWLHQLDEFTGVPRPDLVLLDLNLPAISGRDVLDEIRSAPSLQSLPVVVLTGSKAEEDLAAAYEAGANACVVKPVDPEEFSDRIQSVVAFWVSTAARPPAPDPDNGRS